MPVPDSMPCSPVYLRPGDGWRRMPSVAAKDIDGRDSCLASLAGGTYATS